MPIRIGILADIHDDAVQLRRALDELRQLSAERVVALGDIFANPEIERYAPVAELLSAAGAIGVWGNHDFGLVGDVDDRLRRACDQRVLDFAAGLQPHIVLDDCRFSHVEPWLDPHDIVQLWWFDGPPDTAEKAGRSFSAVPERFLFLGHFHHWRLTAPDGEIAWNGTRPICLAAWQRCLVVVAPVFEGHCALFDTETMELTPRSWPP